MGFFTLRHKKLAKKYTASEVSDLFRRLFSREKVTWDLGKPRYILTAVTT